MSSKYWIKLYHEILDDPKMGRMQETLFARCIKLFLLAGEYNQDGALPSIEDVSWRLRIDAEELESDFYELQKVGILAQVDGIWIVKKFAERQAAMTPAQKMRLYRDNQKEQEYYDKHYSPVTNSVTVSNTDIDIDIDTDKESEEIEVHPIHAILELWAERFPNKPQPKSTTTSIRDKANARMKSTHFRDNWRTALIKASQSPTLQKESWFDLRFFLRNDDNYQKCLDGWMDWKDEQLGISSKDKLKGYEYAGS